MKVVDLRERAATASAPEWVVEGLIPKGYVTLLFGRGGTGKSYMWLSIATHLAVGQPFLGRAVQQGSTLILDAELDDNDTAWRASEVARGMGLMNPPDGLKYVRLAGSISSEEVGRTCRRLVEDIRPVLVVVDALSSAAPDSDPLDAAATRRVLNDLTALGTTVLAIDHVSKDALKRRGAGGSIPQPLGSVAKDNIMRSGIFVEAMSDGTLRLHQTKSTFGKRESKPLTVRPTFGDAFRLDLVRQEPRESPSAKLLDLLPATTEHLAAETGLSKKTVLNRMGELQAKGQVTKEAGEWRIIEA